MVCGCSHFQFIQCSCDVPIQDHRVRAVISCISCTQILSELELMILVWKSWSQSTFVQSKAFSSIPCRQQRKLQAQILCDGNSGWLVLPYTYSCRCWITACCHWCAQSIYLSSRTIQLGHSFSGCCLRGPRLWYHHIYQAYSRGDRVIWIQGSRCTYSSTPWGQCFYRFSDLVLEGFIHRASILIDSLSLISNKYLHANISSAIILMEGKPAIGILRQYYLSSIFKERPSHSGLWLIALQPEIYLAPWAIPWAIPPATTSSKLHILHHNSLGLLKLEARLLNSESCNDSLISWWKPSLGNKTPHKMAVSLIQYTSTNFQLPHYIKIK